GVITALAKYAGPLIWNEGGCQFMLTRRQHDVADAPPTVKLARPVPRPIITPTVQEEPHPGRWVTLSGHQASRPGNGKPDLDRTTAHQGTTEAGRDVMDAISGRKVEAPTVARCGWPGGHARRVALAINDGPDLPACRNKRDRH